MKIEQDRNTATKNIKDKHTQDSLQQDTHYPIPPNNTANK